MSTEAILTLESLTKRFGDLLAVDDLSAEVQPGEVFGLLGPNGAGKTTTIRMVCGELVPDAGRVLLGGRPVTSAADDRARIGLCPQELVVWAKQTCAEELETAGQLYGLSRSTARARGARLLADLGLDAKAKALAGTSSGGQGDAPDAADHLVRAVRPPGGTVRAAGPHPRGHRVDQGRDDGRRVR